MKGMLLCPPFPDAHLYIDCPFCFATTNHIAAYARCRRSAEPGLIEISPISTNSCPPYACTDNVPLLFRTTEACKEREASSLAVDCNMLRRGLIGVNEVYSQCSHTVLDPSYSSCQTSNGMQLIELSPGFLKYNRLQLEESLSCTNPI
eukprot:IDg2251t1